MKNNRQEKILAIIEAEPIETQEQLLSKLQEQGLSLIHISEPTRPY